MNGYRERESASGEERDAGVWFWVTVWCNAAKNVEVGFFFFFLQNR